ncbi:MAG TPA: MerR family transcriptional regulator [Thermoleophilia bacterium]|nr:MerR family transcriptional regulator [Thermoleophilia bacterium]
MAREARDRPLFMISVAAELAEMHPQTLRTYERRGLLRPQRSAKNTRLYSERDVERLRRIQGLTEMGMNLAGVERVLALEMELEALRRQTERLHRQLEEAAERLRTEVRRVEAARRLELVPLRASTTAIVATGRRRRGV